MLGEGYFRMKPMLHCKALLLYLLTSVWFCHSFVFLSSSASSSSSLQKQWEPIYELESETSLKENQLLKTIPEIGKEWKITLDFKPTRFLSNKNTNILWIRSRDGYTLVTIGLSTTKHLAYCLAGQGITKKCYSFHKFLRVELNQWISLEISQVQKSGTNKFLIRWVDVVTSERENSPPATLNEVLVYASAYSNPTYPSPSQPGKIRNLLISIPANADSSWGDWLGTWTNCSATCGSGVSITG